jgi:hypothetical protein
MLKGGAATFLPVSSRLNSEMTGEGMKKRTPLLRSSNDHEQDDARVYGSQVIRHQSSSL